MTDYTPRPIRYRSEYEVLCVCGRTATHHSPEFRCVCGRWLSLVWGSLPAAVPVLTEHGIRMRRR